MICSAIRKLTINCPHAKLTLRMAKTLGQQIKELRDKLDLSLRELAKEIDDGSVSATHLSDIEWGRRFPSDELLEKLAKALKTTKEDLQKYDSRPPLEEIKRKTVSDPNYGFALRTLIDKGYSSEDILRMTADTPERKEE